MSIRIGDTIVAGNAAAPSTQYHPDLFDWKWADHELDDPSWVRADTFSWQNSTVYQAAYQHLVEDISEEVEGLYAWSSSNNVFYAISLTPALGEPIYVKHGQIFVNEGIILQIEGNNAQIYWKGTMYGSVRETSLDEQKGIIISSTTTTETISGTTITYYLTEDGHKIVLPDQESNVTAIYNATGVAWYYIIDTTNQSFKLPRAKHNKYADSLGVIGTGNTLGLTNGTNNVGIVSNGSWSQTGLFTEGAYNQPVGTTTIGTNPKSGNFGVTTDPTKSGIIAQQTQDTDQYKYLYFYVGNFTQTALENTAGVTTEVLNTKVDKGHQVVEFQEPTSSNNYTWYRKYADGWVEQGGYTSGGNNTETNISLPVSMRDIYYSLSIAGYHCNNARSTATPSYRGIYYDTGVITARTTTGFTLGNGENITWQVSGMAAN